ncbi:MAG: ADP-glyceromanno-heptose 6-epimerase [Sphingobacteriales bacterium]|nr:MAG: ADP-glyceromanno-heptose 6-epimerase [Sphingobacteriales bacterium]
MIAVTGAAGFIGSVLTGYLNSLGFDNLVLVDDFSDKVKVDNLTGKHYSAKVHRAQFIDWLEEHPVQAIFHLGARTDTTLMDIEVFKTLNLNYSKDIWEYCAEHKVPLVYASSAATYGDGDLGYDDNESIIPGLRPLNPYGVSKQKFDVWALSQTAHPPFWAGLKFFNVYGPNEYHKGRMASVILHAFNNLEQNGNAIRLFRSHNPGYTDGGQMRDFIYVKDLVKVCAWLMEHQVHSGIYNLGTGKARTFNDLAKSVFAALQLPEKIDYIDTPEDIRDKYQYFTEANMNKLRATGYQESFMSIEEGIKDYIGNYLKEGKYY